jgi:hypothetical protein
MPVIYVNVVFEIVGNISFGSVPRLEVVPAMQLSLGKKKETWTGWNNCVTFGD